MEIYQFVGLLVKYNSIQKESGCFRQELPSVCRRNGKLVVLTDSGEVSFSPEMPSDIFDSINRDAMLYDAIAPDPDWEYAEPDYLDLLTLVANYSGPLEFGNEEVLFAWNGLPYLAWVATADEIREWLASGDVGSFSLTDLAVTKLEAKGIYERLTAQSPVPSWEDVQAQLNTEE